VRAAIEAQRAIYQLNQRRSRENEEREVENLARVSAGLPSKPCCRFCSWQRHQHRDGYRGIDGVRRRDADYTVFGREVNLASRLENASGRGRIFIGQTTYEQLRRDDPALAAMCVELPPRDLRAFAPP